MSVHSDSVNGIFNSVKEIDESGPMELKWRRVVLKVNLYYYVMVLVDIISQDQHRK